MRPQAQNLTLPFSGRARFILQLSFGENGARTFFTEPHFRGCPRFGYGCLGHRGAPTTCAHFTFHTWHPVRTSGTYFPPLGDNRGLRLPYTNGIFHLPHQSVNRLPGRQLDDRGGPEFLQRAVARPGVVNKWHTIDFARQIFPGFRHSTMHAFLTNKNIIVHENVTLPFCPETHVCSVKHPLINPIPVKTIILLPLGEDVV